VARPLYHSSLSQILLVSQATIYVDHEAATKTANDAKRASMAMRVEVVAPAAHLIVKTASDASGPVASCDVLDLCGMCCERLASLCLCFHAVHCERSVCKAHKQVLSHDLKAAHG
jgi:hypothetical protein